MQKKTKKKMPYVILRMKVVDNDAFFLFCFKAAILRSIGHSDPSFVTKKRKYYTPMSFIPSGIEKESILNSGVSQMEHLQAISSFFY